jgi:hypothetical protein
VGWGILGGFGQKFRPNHLRANWGLAAGSRYFIVYVNKTSVMLGAAAQGNFT